MLHIMTGRVFWFCFLFFSVFVFCFSEVKEGRVLGEDGMGGW